MEQDRTNHDEGNGLNSFLIPHPSHVYQAEPSSLKLHNGNTSAEKTYNELNGNHTWLHGKANYGMKHPAKRNESSRISPDLLQRKKYCSGYLQNGGIKRTFSEPSLYGLHQNKKLKPDEEAPRGQDSSFSVSQQAGASNSCSEKDAVGFRTEQSITSVPMQSLRCNSGASKSPPVPQIWSEQGDKSSNCHNRDIVMAYKNKAAPMPNGAIVSATSMGNMPGEFLEKTLSQYNPEHVFIGMQTTTSFTNAINTRDINVLACGTSPLLHTSGEKGAVETSNSELPQVLASVATEVLHNIENSSKESILQASSNFQETELMNSEQQQSENTYQSPTNNCEVSETTEGQVPDHYSLSPNNSLKTHDSSSEILSQSREETGASFQQDSIFRNDSFNLPPISPPSSRQGISHVLSIEASEEPSNVSNLTEENHRGQPHHQGEHAKKMSGFCQQALNSQQGHQYKIQVSQAAGSETNVNLSTVTLGKRQQDPSEIHFKLESKVQDPQSLGTSKESQHFPHLLSQINQQTTPNNETDLVKNQLQQSQAQSQASWTRMTSLQFHPSDSSPKTNEIHLRTMLQLQANSVEQTHPKQCPRTSNESKGILGQSCYQNISQGEQIPALFKAEATHHFTSDLQNPFQKHSPQSKKMNDQQQNSRHFHFQAQSEFHFEQTSEGQLKPQHLDLPLENEQFIHSHILPPIVQTQPIQPPQNSQVTMNSPQQIKATELPQIFPQSNNSQEQQGKGTSLNQLKLEECFEIASNYFKSTEFPVQIPQTRDDHISDITNKNSHYNQAFKANNVMKHSCSNNMHLVSEEKEHPINTELLTQNISHDLQHMQYYPDSVIPKQDLPQGFQEQKSPSPPNSFLQLPFQQAQEYSTMNTNVGSSQATQIQQRYSPYNQQGAAHAVDRSHGQYMSSPPQKDFQKHAAIRWHILNKQQVNQNKSESCQAMDFKSIKAETGSKVNACLPPTVAQLEKKTWKKAIKQESQHLGCENMQQKSIIETMEQQLKQIQVKTPFDHKSLTINSPKHVKIEAAEPTTILTRNSNGADFNSHAISLDQQSIHPNERTPTKRTAGTALNNFLESPSKLLDTPLKNLLDTPVKTQYDFPSCSCVGKF